MAVGANLSYKSRFRTWQKMRRLLLERAGLRGTNRNLCYKAGVPANNTAADNPNALNDLCLDVTNSHLYQCTLYSADASGTTWTLVA